ncbi:MAG: Flp family type IVb pilin [Vampirovibrionales bacterium]|nr:Flp family type IVb pilin [Vampirovibrionales bacterium]
MKMMLRKSRKGQSLAEYGLILALIAIVCIAALSFLGSQIGNSLNDVGNKLFTAISSSKPGSPPAS